MPTLYICIFWSILLFMYICMCGTIVWLWGLLCILIVTYKITIQSSCSLPLSDTSDSTFINQYFFFPECLAAIKYSRNFKVKPMLGSLSSVYLLSKMYLLMNEADTFVLESYQSLASLNCRQLYNGLIIKQVLWLFVKF